MINKLIKVNSSVLVSDDYLKLVLELIEVNSGVLVSDDYLKLVLEHRTPDFSSN